MAGLLVGGFRKVFEFGVAFHLSGVYTDYMNTNTTHTPDTLTIPVTVNGETRQTEFRILEVDRWDRHTQAESMIVSKPEFAAKVSRNAAKVHRVQATGFIFPTETEAKKNGFGKGVGYIPLVELPDGRVAAVYCTANVRNRDASLVGWADKFEGTNAGSKHNAYTKI